MLITVTQEHIDNGVRISAQNCPIALALKERFKVNYAAVCQEFCDIGQFPDEVFGINVPLDPNVSKWIRAFDKKLQVGPFSFELDLSGGTQNET